jgi:hypothetical protein
MKEGSNMDSVHDAQADDRFSQLSVLFPSPAVSSSPASEAWFWLLAVGVGSTVLRAFSLR